MSGSPSPVETAAWPSLPLDSWRDTRDTLHRWTQLVGKTRLAPASPESHWWHIAFYLTPRGLTTSPMPYGSARSPPTSTSSTTDCTSAPARAPPAASRSSPAFGIDRSSNAYDTVTFFAIP